MKIDNTLQKRIIVIGIGFWFAVLALAYMVNRTSDTTKPLLIERYSESWYDENGFRLPQGGLRLDRPPTLHAYLNYPTPFTPAVVAQGIGLERVRLFITIDPLFRVDMGNSWTDEGNGTYSTTLGPINNGEAINAIDSLILHPQDIGEATIKYLINDVTEPSVEGEFIVVVLP